MCILFYFLSIYYFIYFYIFYIFIILSIFILYLLDSEKLEYNFLKFIYRGKKYERIEY